MNKKKVTFICMHNFCCSQIAEALEKNLASDVFDSYYFKRKKLCTKYK